MRTKMNNDVLDEILLFAIDLARQAGQIHLQYFRSGNLNTQNKINDADIVTAADKAAEAAIISGINARYPGHSILAEESGCNNAQSPYEWVIDPLDGTTNFNAGLPIFSVSIGVKYRGETVVGVVFAPYLNELFHAVKGEGAYLNGEPIAVSAQSELSKSVVCTGFPVDKMTTTDNNLDNFKAVMPYTRAIRRLGSAAIDICYVARCSFEAFWELNLHEWDVCAALLIAAEAGAVYEHFLTDRNVSVLVGNPAIEKVVSAMLNRNPG
ncbi:MAG: inositol monophosphatase family protein [Muribaculaceae bacterium]